MGQRKELNQKTTRLFTSPNSAWRMFKGELHLVLDVRLWEVAELTSSVTEVSWKLTSGLSSQSHESWGWEAPLYGVVSVLPDSGLEGVRAQ